jgi:hypothetical protein
LVDDHDEVQEEVGWFINNFTILPDSNIPFKPRLSWRRRDCELSPWTCGYGIDGLLIEGSADDVVLTKTGLPRINEKAQKAGEKGVLAPVAHRMVAEVVPLLERSRAEMPVSRRWLPGPAHGARCASSPTTVSGA